MNLALSNFAWDNKDSELIFTHLEKNNINQIESILTKIDSWENLTHNNIAKYKSYLDSYNINVYSIQSLFYGVDCKITDVDIIVSHFKRLIEYATILNAKILVFGSPSLRQKHDKWEISLVDIFTQVDKLLENKNIKVVIEPNASVYNGLFFNNIEEIVNFIKQNNLVNVRTMVDTHNSILENRNPINDFLNYIDYIEHIHISEPNLSPISNKIFHSEFAIIIKDSNYNKVITYEVLKNPHILDNITTFTQIYNK